MPATVAIRQVIPAVRTPSRLPSRRPRSHSLETRAEPNVDLLADVNAHSIGVEPTGIVTFQSGGVTLGGIELVGAPDGGFDYQLTVPTTTKGLVKWQQHDHCQLFG